MQQLGMCVLFWGPVGERGGCSGSSVRWCWRLTGGSLGPCLCSTHLLQKGGGDIIASAGCCCSTLAGKGLCTPSACRAVQGGWCVLLQGAGRGGSKVAVVDKGHTALWTGAGLWLRLYAYHTTSCRGLMYWRAPLLGAVLRQAVPWRQLPGAVLG